MQKAIYPGSFDPVTFGHIDIIKRAAARVDELIVGVLNNNAKIPLFSAEERVRMLKEVTKNIPNVRIITFRGLLVDFARREDADIIIRGLRAITDFEHELQMTQANHKMYDKMDTIFFATSVEYSYLSSSTVKEIAAFGGDVSQFVPPIVAGAIREKIITKGECKNNEQSYRTDNRRD